MSTTIGDENPIRTLGDYSKPSHEGYRNTIELLVGNNVVPLRSYTIRLVQNGCSFHGIRSEDPNQHLKDFLKLVDSLDLDGENRERTRMHVPSTSDRRLIELENQVQRLMEAYLAPTQPTQVNKVTTSCEICSSPHDTQSCMEDPKQAFVEYASSRTDETEAKWSTSLVLSARSYPNMDPQSSTRIQGSINTVIIHSEKQNDSYDEKAKENEEEEKDSPENIHVNPSTFPDPSVAFIIEKVLKFNSFFESLRLVPQSSDTEVVYTKGDNGEVTTTYPSRRYGVSVPALTKDHRGIKLNTPYLERLNTPYSKYGMNIIFWKISSLVPTPRNPQYAEPVEAEFPAIVIDNTVTPQDALPCKSQVSTPVNDEIDFKISFDESDNEDYTIICDINSFSYKMISVNNLKTDSEKE
ncbi:hypothetical protein Tco_0866341 [Tanacetum coccineum]